MSEIMAINNVSMEQQIGMLTGVTEITRNASSASRGLVMISSRLTQVLDESSSTGKKLTKIYNDLGIELKDENGQLRSHYDILGDLAGQWDNLSENQQKYIALTSAGARQQQNFVALMENWNQVAKATATAYNSMGSAQRENEKVMDSVAKKVEILKSEFQQLVIGKGGLQEFAKNIISIGIALLKFANSDVGEVIIKTTLLITTFSILINSYSVLSSRILDAGRSLATYALAAQGLTISQIAATVASMGLADALKMVAAAALDSAIAFATSPIGLVLLLLSGITIAAIAGEKALEKYNKRLETANDKLNDLKDSAKDSKDELDNLKNSLKNIKDQLEENKEAKLNTTNAEDLKILEKETKELERQEEVIKRQIALKERELKLAEEDAEKQARETLKTTTESKIKKTELVDSFSGAGTGEYVGVTVTPTKELELVIEKYKELENESKNLNNQLSQVDTKSEEYAKLSAQLDENATEMENVKNRGIEMSDIIENSAESLVSTNGATLQYKNSLYELTDGFYELIGIQEENSEEAGKTIEELEEEAEEAEELSKHVEELAKSLGITATELEGLRERFDDLTLDNFLSQLAEFKQTIDDTNSTIDNLQSALETASGALEEYNANGYLTIDTFQGLMGISAQYLAALINENGQLEINQQTLGNLVDTLKIAKIEELAEAAAMEIAALQHQESATSADAAQRAVDAAGDAFIRAGDKAAKASTGIALFNAQLKKATGGNLGDFSGSEKVIIDKYRKLAKEISTLSVNTTKAGNAASSAGRKGAGAAKQAKDATKELNKELEETKKKYDTVIKWISKQYDKEIDSIKKAEKEALKAEEEKIKAKEKEKDEALDAIEKEIKALEKAKDARKKYWDNQIDALKKANDARKDALELQEKLDALEKAKATKVKIYKEGQGFVYDVDQTAVAKAQKELDEYLSEKAYEDELARLEALRDAEMDNYEQRINAMNEYKDNVQANYEAQIEAMNEHKEQLEAQYEAEIEMYENYKQQFEDMVNAYEEEQNRLLAQQLTGIDFENKNWMTRLDNLQKFVNEYNKLQKQLGGDNTNVSADKNFSSGSSGGGGSSSGGSNSSKRTVTNRDTPSSQYSPTQSTKGVGTALSHQGYNGMPTNVRRYASGTNSISDDEIAIVGENPNQEIVIGSKINNGELMNLGKGTGVVNADSSKTLAGMLNQVGQFGASGFGSGNGTLNNNINNDSLVINGVTVQGANIKDPETFVNGLLNLKAEALQRAYRHR